MEDKSKRKKEIGIKIIKAKMRIKLLKQFIISLEKELRELENEDN